MNGKNGLVLLIGRILLSVIFIMAGFSKIGGFAGTAGYISSVGLPFAEVLTVLTIIIEIVGGLMILFGFMAKKASWVLAIFTILAALLFHTNFTDQAEMMSFMKNLAIAGGFLYVAVYGAGSISLDTKLKKNEPPAEADTVE